MKNNKVIIYTDGGAKGNPGPASIGAVIEYNNGKKEYSEQIGEATNNIAEYKALVFALQKTRQLLGKKTSKEVHIKAYSDSELMVKQLNGEYKIKNTELKDLFIEIWNLKQDFKEVKFEHIKREKNSAADRLVNEAMF